MDMISNLPDNIIDAILVCLPTIDAARTCVLSRKWRYKWIGISQLDFDYRIWRRLKEDYGIDERGYAMIIYQVLLSHEGPIDKFTLCVPDFARSSEIDPLIRFLSKNEIQDFTLYARMIEGYKMHSSLFMCLHLRRLSLSNCSICPPPNFKGFNWLISLKLESVKIGSDVLNSLISSCRSLEQLKLIRLYRPDFLEIDAPNLKLFYFRGDAVPIHFKKTTLLSSVTILSHPQSMFILSPLYISEFFHTLTALQKLKASFSFVKLLSQGQVQTRPAATLGHLKYLDLDQLDLSTLDVFSCVLCLIKSCPNLEKLWISMTINSQNEASADVIEFIKVQEYADVSLDQLGDVKLENFDNTIPEMELIKLLLDRSPKLKSMVIMPWRSILNLGKEFEISEKLRQFETSKKLDLFHRASPDVEVKYGDYL